MTKTDPVINRITRDDIDAFVNQPTANMYQHIAIKSAIYPGKGTPQGLIYVALKGAGEAGEFAEHVGKAMRDDDYGAILTDPDTKEYLGQLAVLTPERYNKLIKEVGDQLWYCAAKCTELGITLSVAMKYNLDKLCERTDKGTLQGSGDDR